MRGALSPPPRGALSPPPRARAAARRRLLTPAAGTAGRPTFITRDAGASNAGSSEDDDNDDAEYPHQNHSDAYQEEVESDVASDYSESASDESEDGADARGIPQWPEQDDAETLASLESARETGWKYLDSVMARGGEGLEEVDKLLTG